MSDAQQQQPVDWAGWETVQDAYGRERHRPLTDRDGQPFIERPEDGAIQLNAETFPPGVRVMSHGPGYALSFYQFRPLKYVRRPEWDRWTGPWGTI